MKFLADAIKADQSNASVVEDTLKETLPVAPLALAPPRAEDPYDFETPFYNSREIYAYADEVAVEEAGSHGHRPDDARRVAD